MMQRRLVRSHNLPLRFTGAVATRATSSCTTAARLQPSGAVRTLISTGKSHASISLPLHRPQLFARFFSARPLGGIRASHRDDEYQEEPVKPAEVVSEVKSIFQRVEELWEADQTEEAIAGMHEILALDPQNFDVLERLGDMYLAVGNYAASDQKYSEAVAILEQDATRGLQQWRQRMAFLLVKLGESKERMTKGGFDEAEAYYQRAIELNAECLEAYHRLGFLNLNEGYLETAERLFDQGLQHAPEHGFVVAELWYGKAQRKMENKEWRKAAELLKKACAADSTYAPAFFQQGLCLQKERDWLGAIQAFDTYIEMFDKYYTSHAVDAVDQRLNSSDLLSDAMLRRGVCYLHYGDLPVALTDLNNAIMLDNPKFLPFVYHYRGKVHFNNSEFYKAIDDQTEAIKLNPDLFDAYLDRSTCYDLVGMHKEAEEDKHRYEQMKRAKSWEMRQSMLESHFGPQRGGNGQTM